MPDSVEKSFLRGQITTGVRDSGFQMSSPFRHATALVKFMEQSPVKVLMKFND